MTANPNHGLDSHLGLDRLADLSKLPSSPTLQITTAERHARASS
jgi:hypothetical protein